MGEGSLPTQDRMHLVNSRCFIELNDYQNRGDLEQRDKKDCTFNARVAENQRTSWLVQHAKGTVHETCGLQMLQRTGLCHYGEISKCRSQAKTEHVRAVTDPDAAMKKARRILMLNNRAAALILLHNNVPNAPPISPPVSPPPYNPAPCVLTMVNF